MKAEKPSIHIDALDECTRPLGVFQQLCAFTVGALVFITVAVCMLADMYPLAVVCVPVATIGACVIVEWRRRVALDQLRTQITVAKLIGNDVDWVYDVANDVSERALNFDYRYMMVLAVSICCAVDFMNTHNTGHLIGVCAPCALIALKFIAASVTTRVTVYNTALERTISELQT